MATLEKIRKRAGILVMAAIGLAMLGFILGDFKVGSGTRHIAEINGQAYEYQEYQNEQRTLLDFYKMNYGENLSPQIEQQVEDETWKRMVRNSVMGQSYEQIGLEVSTDELKSMVAGDQATGLAGASAYSEPHPIVLQMFTNPETGEFNRYFMTSYFNSLGDEQYAQEKQRWVFIENEIVEERLNQKYINIISKGLRPNSLEAKKFQEVNDKRVDFSYVAKNFSSILDSEISYTEADLKAYYKENQEQFKSSEARTIEYVSFDIVPSEADNANSRLWASQTKNEFSRIENDELASYVNGVSDQPFQTTYFNEKDLSQLLKDSLLSKGEDYIFGPYFEDDAYKLSKISDIQMRPDSVRARHILIGYSTVGTVQRANELADSIMQVIENGGDFNEMAMMYSTDESNRAIGGDLGWFSEGRMVPAFNDACFENNVGDLVKTTTNFGVHIIRIENQSRPVEKVQVATIVHSVYPSNETNQDYYNRAVKFRGKATNLEKFEEQAKEFGLDPRVVPNITREQRTITGLDNPSRIIGWAYTNDEGEVSDIFDGEDRYIIVALTDIKTDGYAPFEDVRSEVELAVIKQKKGELIAASMEESMKQDKDLQAIAEEQGVQVGEANRVQFANTFVSNIGMEPFIVGAAMELPVDQLAGPYIGENSVFVIKVVNRDEPAEEASLDQTYTRMNYTIQSRSTYEAYNAMIEEAKIEDNRLKFFYGGN